MSRIKNLFEFIDVWKSKFAGNLADFVISKFLDAAITLVLVRVLEPASFGELATAQAVSAPFFLIFFVPSTVLFRNYSQWQSKSLAVIANELSVLRFWGFLLFLLSLILPALMSLFSPISFWALVWAFSMTQGQNWCGGDREYFRIQHRYGILVGTATFQKIFVIVYLASVFVNVFEFRIDALAIIVMASYSISQLSYYFNIKKEFQSLVQIPFSVKEKLFKIADHIKGFSFWNHLSGVGLYWVQSLDILILNFFRHNQADIGVYAIGLKLSNLVQVLPNALIQFFTVWLSKRPANEGVQRERKRLFQSGILISVITALQSVLIMVLFPYFIHFLVKPSWTLTQIADLKFYITNFMVGLSFYVFGIILFSYFGLRLSAVSVFRFFTLPQIFFASAIYGLLVRFQGLHGAAHGNILVGVVTVMLGLLTFSKVRS